MFKRKKKTGCETPEYTAPPMPNVEPVKKPKVVNRNYVGTKDSVDKFLTLFEDAVKIEDVEVYWSDSAGVIGLATTPEWKDYLMGVSNIIITKETTQND